MSTSSLSTLEEAIRNAGQGWLIDDYVPTDKAMEHIRNTLKLIQDKANDRLGIDAPDFSEETLLKEYQRNPQRVRGFFQALRYSNNPGMLLMVWRIIQGMEIHNVELTYEFKKSFQLRVTLISPDGNADHEYCSEDIYDTRLFPHLGIMKVDDLPIFDGFYPLRIRGE